MTSHATRFVRPDGTAVWAMQFDGRVAGFAAMLQGFPGRVRPHPHRDDALLVLMVSGRDVRITAGDWVVEQPDGSLRTYPDDQFRMSHHHPEAVAA